MANGIIIIDKPADWTSMDVCAKLRGILKTKKVGHAGTLDPMATGVLPVFCGGASKAVDLQLDHDKAYRAVLRLGQRTDTGDITGTALETAPVTVGESELKAVLPQFTGLDALYFATPMADFLSIFVTVIFIIVEMRRLRKLERGEITAKF